MSFGLINILIIFQAYINRALEGLLDITYIVYMNDIYIFNDLIEEYTKYVREVFTRLRKIKLYVKFSKYEFNKKEITFLRYVINIYDIRINNAKIRVVRE
jgi:Reverse transcriptase (RNA-dependent DNA polymerase)